MMDIASTITGRTVEIILMASPAMMLVPCPVVLALRHVFDRAVHSGEVLGDDNDQTGENQTEHRHPKDAERRNHKGCTLKWGSERKNCGHECKRL